MDGGGGAGGGLYIRLLTTDWTAELSSETTDFAPVTESFQNERFMIT
jgi:hypothetical protein